MTLIFASSRFLRKAVLVSLLIKKSARQGYKFHFQQHIQNDEILHKKPVFAADDYKKVGIARFLQDRYSDTKYNQ